MDLLGWLSSLPTALVVALGVLLSWALCHGPCAKFWRWFSLALAEPDGSPSASRMVLVATSFTLLASFVWTTGWSTYKTGQVPALEGWGNLIFFAQGGGALGYIVNQVRRGLKVRNGGKDGGNGNP